MPRRVEQSRRSDPTTYSAERDPQRLAFTRRADAEERARFLDAMESVGHKPRR
ncbi:hypothetical protein ACWD48_19640 [Streptomyces sp. NPDC002519]